MRPKPTVTRKTKAFSLPIELVLILRNYSEDQNVTESSVVEHALKQFLNTKEN